MIKKYQVNIGQKPIIVFGLKSKIRGRKSEDGNQKSGDWGLGTGDWGLKKYNAGNNHRIRPQSDQVL